MKPAMTQPELQETPGPRQRRQHIGGLSVSLPRTAVDFQATILFTRCDGLPSYPQFGGVNRDVERYTTPFYVYGPQSPQKVV
jgi:hypothetical protein